MMSSYSQAPEYTTNEKKTIQNVINGDQPYEGAKDKQGYILTAIQDAAIKAKIEHWTPSDYKNANATKLAFSIGKYGEQIAAANTSIDHMMDYKTLLANNGNTQIPVVNEAWNRIKAAFGME